MDVTENIQNHLLFVFLSSSLPDFYERLVGLGCCALLGRAVDLLDVHLLKSFHPPTEEEMKKKTVCGGSSSSSCEIGNNNEAQPPPPTFMLASSSSPSSLNVCEDLIPNICEYVSSGR